MALFVRKVKLLLSKFVLLLVKERLTSIIKWTSWKKKKLLKKKSLEITNISLFNLFELFILSKNFGIAEQYLKSS